MKNRSLKPGIAILALSLTMLPAWLGSVSTKSPASSAAANSNPFKNAQAVADEQEPSVASASPGADAQRQLGKRGQSKNSAGRSNEQIIHMLNRMTMGPAPGDLEMVKKIGVDAYINQQLHPQNMNVPENLQKLAQADALNESPAKLFLTYGRPALKEIAQKGNSDNPADKKELQKMLRDTYQKLYLETSTARIDRAVESPAQLQEVMTDFWYNHFNISVDKNLDHLWVGSFEEQAIRPHVLGKFRDLLGATAHHAAMLFYLDNWQNTAAKATVASASPNANPKGKGRFSGINENYARELMELHTLGVDGGYTQKDVQELARILTGLGLPPGAGGGFGNRNAAQRLAMINSAGARRKGIQNFGGGFGQNQEMFQNGGNPPAQVDLNNKLGSYFDASRHDFGEKVVLGYKFQGTGEDEIEKVLNMLAKHPNTAHHISYQLAQYFVADTPPATLVDKLSKRFLETDGDISEVLGTLFHSPEFWDSKYENAKFKSPYRFLVSSLRATNADIIDVKPSLGVLTQLGMPLYKCLTPDGYKNTKEAWLNPDNLINRINFATTYGTGRFPGAKPKITEPADVADCIGPTLSNKTIDSVMGAPEMLRVSLLLGSPEFMKY